MAYLATTGLPVPHTRTTFRPIIDSDCSVNDSGASSASPRGSTDCGSGAGGMAELVRLDIPCWILKRHRHVRPLLEPGSGELGPRSAGLGRDRNDHNQ
mgnify:CR=1 FL=1